MTQVDEFARVVLGTVQIGIPYGRRSNAGVMREDAAMDILATAWRLGIREFDTAEAYGVSAARLARWLRESGNLGAAHVITKIAATLPDDEIHAAALSALHRFEGAGRLTLLSHGSMSRERWAKLRDASSAVNSRAGQSVYETGEVVAAWSVPDVSVVQAPANVFDMRAVRPPTDDSREMHYRSVFLQGLLLDAPGVAESRVDGGGSLAGAVKLAADRAGAPAASLLVAAVLRASRTVDKVVLGADSPDDLEPLVIATLLSPESVDEFVRNLSQVPAPAPAVLDPRCWRRKP